jgi:dethiobiotin synthetase
VALARIVVVGTGTDVGKTHVSACLLAFARSRGLRAAAYKPVATGVTSECTDCAEHAAALGAPYVPPTYAYARPVSPHLAAREEGRPIDLAVIEERATRLSPDAGTLLVETAGGLFSPLSDTRTNADLVLRLLPASVLLVAPDRIGVLHDVGAAVRAAKGVGLTVAAVALSAPAVADASTGSNAGEISALGLGPVVVFPRGPCEGKESLEAAEALWGRLVSSGACGALPLHAWPPSRLPPDNPGGGV